MNKEITLTVTPETAAEPDLLKKAIAKNLSVSLEQIAGYAITRQSLDARHNIKFNLWIRVFLGEMPEKEVFIPHYRSVKNGKDVIIVGTGPAGLFSALKLIELGYRPVLLERGRDVSSRKKDIARISTAGILEPESNYCFGEGGAGTFSDGKLYTRSTKRGDISHVLQVLNYHGADNRILYEAHPHIGTEKLPEIIKKIRQTILDCGGEIHFSTKMESLIISEGKMKGIRTDKGEVFSAIAVVLATGHSARDIYMNMHASGLLLENKGFAMGVRVEHPQDLIDQIQYHGRTRDAFLPAASYNLAVQSSGRGVYSFCMCPGGYIVPAATSGDEIVVNGMSSSKRHTPFANSGIVVEIRPEDVPHFQKYGPLCGLYYQKELEVLAKANSNSGQTAPAQRLTDFMSGKLSASLPKSSYLPGLQSSLLSQWLPEYISKRLQEGFLQFEKKMHGYLSQEAYIAGVESRTSSPVRIPRDPVSHQHPQVKGLFPCGEGSGYAGGIVSSAMDGELIAIGVHQFFENC